MAYKLDIGATLRAIDSRDFNYFSRLTEEEAKGFAPPVVLRWASAFQGSAAGDRLIEMNRKSNVDFWELSKYPDLQFMMIASSGNGGYRRPEWIAMAKGGPKTDALTQFMRTLVPEANDQEIDIILRDMDKKSFVKFVEGSGILDADAKPIIAAFERRLKDVRAVD